MTIERRRFVSLAGVSTRAEDDKRYISGLGAVFYNANNSGTEFELARYGDYRIVERVAPGAFDRALQDNDDVRGLFNHDMNAVLGRVSSGTMKLSKRSDGLYYEIAVPDTTLGRDIYTLADRKDINGSSFSFRARKVTWEEDRENGIDYRILEDVQLIDVGPVTFPAYQATTADARSAASMTLDVDERSAKALHDEWQAWRSHVDNERRKVRERVEVEMQRARFFCKT